MDCHVPSKKRKRSRPSSPRSAVQPVPRFSTQQGCSLEIEDEEEGSTDLMLALLSSLHPDTDQQLLLDVLLAHDGSVEAASASLATPISPPRKPKTASSAPGYQSSLSSFLTQSGSGKPTKSLFKKGKTLHLYDPVDIAAHTPCSIIHNFLPREEANALLEELLKEAETYERSNFKLFDSVVQSPHTACFYVESWEEAQRQKTEYIYNGGKLTDIRPLTPRMRSLTPLVASTVNAHITLRISSSRTGSKLPHQSSLPWTPNAAFVNCYNGPTENVGWHSDQLTYLGPRATIGSLSLGVAREFRVRRVVPDDGDEGVGKGDQQAQISIHLPHNSLLVMHAEMQEEWKHCIAPAQSITPHPVSGNRRINVTYRDYKSYMHPRFTPRCLCRVPAVLRVVQRKRANLGRYFWMCYAGNVPDVDKKGCDWFEWAEFDDDGIPVWKHKPGSAS
ncbi:Alpha-ketoglutarate-dependent dioxygenase alkB-like protein [Diplocarpon rosae]|nr:Alpha-ketoglutarate-dependent dioxygenase alkB-like protein [Diplocarpon rosae]